MIEDWDKPRGHGDKFTEAEKTRLRSEYLNGTSTSVVARELQCSRRAVNKWFEKFSNEGAPKIPRKRRAKTVPEPKSFDPKAARESRFYRSNFEL